MQWFTGRLTGAQLLQLIHLSISIISSAAGLHFFLWQVAHPGSLPAVFVDVRSEVNYCDGRIDVQLLQ